MLKKGFYIIVFINTVLETLFNMLKRLDCPNTAQQMNGCVLGRGDAIQMVVFVTLVQTPTRPNLGPDSI